MFYWYFYWCEVLNRWMNRTFGCAHCTMPVIAFVSSNEPLCRKYMNTYVTRDPNIEGDIDVEPHVWENDERKRRAESYFEALVFYNMEELESIAKKNRCHFQWDGIVFVLNSSNDQSLRDLEAVLTDPDLKDLAVAIIPEPGTGERGQLRDLLNRIPRRSQSIRVFFSLKNVHVESSEEEEERGRTIDQIGNIIDWIQSQSLYYPVKDD